MPAKSKAQHRYMRAMLAGDKPKGGRKRPSRAVAKDFVEGVSPKGLPERKKKKRRY